MGTSRISQYAEGLEYLDVIINATHLNYVNGNSLLYTVDGATLGSKSWLRPYEKPQLVHHDKLSDAVGRILDVQVLDIEEDETAPPDHIKLKVRIQDEQAIEKVLKGIYLTCSVGSTTTRVKCSSCGQIITEEGLCEHEKGGRDENGESVYWIIEEISYRENSFVNTPADPYSRIVSIDLGNGFMSYKEFLDNRESLINELTLEDEMKNEDAKLSTAARKKLPDSAFCGPDRSFPAHDKAHVTAGLRLLNRSNFSSSTKAKIKACLFRKGKKHGITPAKDELQETPNLMTYRMDDSFTEEELAAIKAWFDQNPKAESEEEDAAIMELTDVEIDLRAKIIEYFSDKNNSGIQDKDFHKFAEEDLGVEESVAETTVYAIMSSFFAAGKSKNVDDKVEYDDDQLEKGVEVELEHTSDAAIATKIAQDHLAEIPDYYTRLEEMEKEAGVKGYDDSEDTSKDTDDKKDEDDSLEALKAENEELKKQLSSKDSILTSKEDEIHQLMDENAKLEEAYRSSVVNSIVDLKTLSDKETDKEELTKKYIVRKIDSLVDTIEDLRSDMNLIEDKEVERVEDPTLQDTEQNDSDKEKTSNEDNTPEDVNPKFAVFYQKNWEDR